jgi:hypothetical protein
MRTHSPIPRIAVSAMLLGSALLALGCGEESGYETVNVTTPEFATDGPILTMAQWRNRVEEVCREAMSEVGAVSGDLAKDLQDEPAAPDEAAISRMAFEASKPVIEEHLGRLAALRAPPEVEDEYQDFVATLTAELRWSGRIAHMIGDDGAEEELLSADQSLAAAAAEVTAFIHAQRLRGCLPSLKDK